MLLTILNYTKMSFRPNIGDYSMNLISVEFILELFKENKIHEDKSNTLMQRFPGSKGFSVASVEREQLHVTPRI